MLIYAIYRTAILLATLLRLPSILSKQILKKLFLIPRSLEYPERILTRLLGLVQCLVCSAGNILRIGLGVILAESDTNRQDNLFFVPACRRAGKTVEFGNFWGVEQKKAVPGADIKRWPGPGKVYYFRTLAVCVCLLGYKGVFLHQI